MKILVTGCQGMLGRAVMARLAPGHEVRGVDLADGDLAHMPAAEALVRLDPPDWIINCAAWTAVDGAEARQDEAMAANAGIPGNLAVIGDDLGCGLTHLSTDYVFSGQGDGFDEDNPRAPLNVYGRTKARGEKAVEKMTAPWQIVRTSWLFGDGPANFVRTIAGLLGKRDTLKVVDDQHGNPTYTEDLAAVLEFLVTGRHRGIFHGTNAGTCSWFEFAQVIAVEAGCDPGRILPCSSREYPTSAVRPACSILRSAHLEALGCPARPAWQDALHRYFQLLTSGRARHPLS